MPINIYSVPFLLLKGLEMNCKSFYLALFQSCLLNLQSTLQIQKCCICCSLNVEQGLEIRGFWFQKKKRAAQNLEIRGFWPKTLQIHCFLGKNPIQYIGINLMKHGFELHGFFLEPKSAYLEALLYIHDIHILGSQKGSHNNQQYTYIHFLCQEGKIQKSTIQP